MSNKKKVILIIAVVSFLLLILSLFYFFHRNKNISFEEKRIEIDTTKKEKDKVDSGDVKMNINESTESEEKDGEYYKKAEATGDYKFCEKIEKKVTRNFCLENVASLFASNDACKLINENEDKNYCLDLAALKNAERNSESNSCSLIKDPMLQKTCIQIIMKNNFLKADCEGLSDNDLKDTCLSEKNLKIARTEKKADICLLIPNLIYRANCLAEVKNIPINSDFDKDGLNFLQEFQYGTDPDKSDTDGDGFLDGIEIKKKFNPLGDGLAPVWTRCEDIPNASMKLACFAESPNKIINLGKCDAIRDWNLRSYCERREFIVD